MILRMVMEGRVRTEGRLLGFHGGPFLSVPVSLNFGHSGDLLDDLGNPRLAQTSLKIAFLCFNGVLVL